MDRKYLLGLALIVVVLISSFMFKGFGEQLPHPGEELFSNESQVGYPYVGLCGSKEVTFWGKPSYDMDTSMKHMWSENCMSWNQCFEWVPKAYKGDAHKLSCCVQNGICYYDEFSTNLEIN